MEIDISSKCRVCLNDDRQMHYLFSEFDQGITLWEIFTSTTMFQVEKNDGLSPYLCQNCTTIVIDFYNLKVICMENENQIRTLLPKIEESGKHQSTEEIKEITIITEQQNDAEDSNESGNSEEQDVTIKLEVYSGSEDDDDVDDSHDDGFNTKSETGEMTGNYIDPDVLSLNQEDSANPTSNDAQVEYRQVAKYTCLHCGDCFLYKEDIESHITLQHQDAEGSCEEYCEISVVKVKNCDEEDGNVLNKCRYCKEVFENEDAYKEHLETHKKNVCNVCGAMFVKKSYLQDHQEVHSTEKRHVCAYCNKAFQRRTVLVKHRRIHTHPRQCVCEICGKAFNDRGTLKTHIMLIHLKSRNYSCIICGIKFSLKATLDKHLRRHQNKQREFFCSECPLGYKDKSSLDRHYYVKHSGANSKSACDVCKKEFTTVSNMQKHKRTCHNNSTS